MVKFEKNTDGNWVVSAGRRQFVVENWEDFILAVSKVDKLKDNGINSLSVDRGAVNVGMPADVVDGLGFTE